MFFNQRKIRNYVERKIINENKFEYVRFFITKYFGNEKLWLFVHFENSIQMTISQKSQMYG
jgi:hypothetical protein